MRLKTTLVFLLSLLYGGLTFAQLSKVTEVYGKVTDATTHELMPGVNVRLLGGLAGTSTDLNGDYNIKTVLKCDSIRFSYTSYVTKTVAVQQGTSQQIDIALDPNVRELGTVFVDPGKREKHHIDTAAMYVYHKVVDNKKDNRSDDINTYKYEAYDKLQFALLNTPNKFLNFWLIRPLIRPFRFIFNNTDTIGADKQVFIPGLLKEQVSDVYYRKHPKSARKFIKAEVFSGINNPSINKLADNQFAEIDAYDNQFIIAGIAFPSPFSPAGSKIYNYHIIDTNRIDGRISYGINFVGKFKEDLSLIGNAWVDSATWAIKSITFRPNSKSNINFINDYNIRQDFSYINNQHWLMDREELITVGSLLKKKNKFSILVTKLHSRRNFELDGQIPDTIFNGLEQIILLDSARERSNAFWDSSRFEPLTPQQRRVYHNIDTIKGMRIFKTYQSLARFVTAAYIDAGPISIGRVLNFVSRDNVEGWRLRFGFETNPRFKDPGTPIHEFFHKFYFNAYAAYGLKDKDFKYRAAVRIALPRINDRWQVMEAMYRYDMQVPGQDERQTVLTFDNVLTLLSGTEWSKIMKVRDARFTYEREWIRDFSTTTSFDEKTYYSVPGVFDFSRTTPDGTTHQLNNFGITEFMLDMRYSHQDQYYADAFYRFFRPTKYPIFMFRYTIGMVNMQGAYYTYHNLNFTVKQSLRSLLGTTDYLFRAGTILGRVPYTAAFMTQGNLGILLDKFNYNLLSEFEFVTDKYASFWVEHHFKGFFFNKIPGFNKLRLREVLIFKSLIGSYDTKNYEVLDRPASLANLRAPGPIPYMEGGFGIENIFYIARVDFLWRLSYRDRTLGPTWGIKIAIAPGF